MLHKERRTVFNLCYGGLDSGLVGICYGCVWGNGEIGEGESREGEKE